MDQEEINVNWNNITLQVHTTCQDLFILRLIVVQTDFANKIIHLVTYTKKNISPLEIIQS